MWRRPDFEVTMTAMRGQRSLDDVLPRAALGQERVTATGSFQAAHSGQIASGAVVCVRDANCGKALRALVVLKLGAVVAAEDLTALAHDAKDAVYTPKPIDFVLLRVPAASRRSWLDRVPFVNCATPAARPAAPATAPRRLRPAEQNPSRLALHAHLHAKRPAPIGDRCPSARDEPSQGARPAPELTAVQSM
jgi:hypothetical protein